MLKRGQELQLLLETKVFTFSNYSHLRGSGMDLFASCLLEHLGADSMHNCTPALYSKHVFPFSQVFSQLLGYFLDDSCLVV